MKKKSATDYIFCFAVGGVYLYALHRTILSATFISIDSLTLYLIGLASIAVFAAVLYNRYTVFLAVLFVTVLGAGLFLTYEDVRYQYPELYEMFLMVTGRIPYRPHLGRIVVWIVSMLMGLIAVIFMLHQFSFSALFAGGAAVFLFTWLPGFSRDERAFLIFLAAFCAILVRKTVKSSGAALAAVPLCVAAVFFANMQIPSESELFVSRELRRFETGLPVNELRDFFHGAFNPLHFSFQRTGFSGSGGRLGGPVSPDNRFVMTVYAPGRTYLAGAISNTYTGDRWLATLAEGDINTHGLPPSQFEMLETTAALIRGATHQDFRFDVTTAEMDIPTEEARRIPQRHFQVLGADHHAYEEFRDYIGFIPGFDYEVRTSTSSFFIGASTWVDDPDFWNITDFQDEDETHEEWMERNEQRWDTFAAISDFVNEAHEAGRLLEYFTLDTTQTHRMQQRYYWHTYLPLETLTVRQAQRTGAIFTPARAHDFSFAYGSVDYAPYIEITPGGTKQTPRFMTRETGYYVGFLNVDTRLSFVEHLLRSAGAGVYEAQGATREPQMPTLTSPRFAYEYLSNRGWIRGATEWMPDPPMRFVSLFHQPLTVPEFIAMVDFYVPSARPVSGRGRPVSMVNDAGQFMRLMDSFSETVLAEYAREVREHFLDVPDSVPQRVRDLTADIVAAQTNDFDRVLAIRDYLLHFPYTLQPAPVPRGVCFVDFFLFEGQEGYCTYFASAMAIMARLAGVPSRYVEGFVVPPPSEAGEGVQVTNRMAHAWAEVYLEGFGWHIIESTPTYALLADEPAGIPPLIFDPAAFERVQDMMEDFRIPGGAWHDFVPREPAPQEEEPAEPSFIFAYVILAAALGLAAIPAGRFVQKEKRRRRIEKLPPNAQLIAHFNAITEIISRYKTAPEPGETPLAYGARYGKRFAFRSDTVFYRDLIALYYKAKYSPAEITPEEAALMKEAHSDMLRLLYVRGKIH